MYRIIPLRMPKGRTSDPFEVIREFRSIAAQAAIRTLDSSGSEPGIEMSSIPIGFWRQIFGIC